MISFYQDFKQRLTSINEDMKDHIRNVKKSGEHSREEKEWSDVFNNELVLSKENEAILESDFNELSKDLEALIDRFNTKIQTRSHA